jgi:hypothetical protein
MKAGTLSEAVAQAAIEKAEEEIRAIERMQPAKEEKHRRGSFACFREPPTCCVSASAAGTCDYATRALSSRGAQHLVSTIRRESTAASGMRQAGREALPHCESGMDRAVLLEAAGSCLKVGSGDRI